MALATVLRALLRGNTSVEQSLEGTRRGALLAQYDLPRYAELVRQNAVWRVGQATATAAIIGSTYPTTACQMLLYNGEAEGSGKSYVILSVGGVQIAAGAALASWSIIFGVSQIEPTTLPTADIAVSSVRPLRGNGGAYGGRAIIDLAPTLDVDPLYMPVPGQRHASNPVNSLAGPVVTAEVDGLIVLPPKSLLALHVVAADVGVTTRLNVVWAEVDL